MILERSRHAVVGCWLVLLSGSPADAHPSSPIAVKDTEEASSTAATPGASHGLAMRGSSALEVSASVGPSVVFGEPANPELSPSASRWGALLSATLAYRSDYFITPSLEVGHGWLARGHAELPSGPWGEAGRLEQELRAWLISPGIATRIWRFRPRLGLGLAIVTQAFTFSGEDSSSSQYPLASQLVVDFDSVELSGILLDFQAGLVQAPGAGLTLARFGIAARFDIVTFSE